MSADNGLGEGVGIPGLSPVFPNEHVETMKSPAWAAILRMLGANGKQIMMHLILHCGLYVPVVDTDGVYYQISGKWTIKAPTTD